VSRSADVRRSTGETDVRVRVDLDGSGQSEVATGVGFFDHTLTLLARHSLIDLEVSAAGDLETGSHHTVEDVGITLGQAVREAIGDASGIRRYGNQILPMAETKVEVAVDVSNRPYLVYRVPLDHSMIGTFDGRLTEDFLYAFAHNAGLDLHVELRYGQSPHHVVEAVFKGVARALRTALERDPRGVGLPTVKGAL
jgi:imidazoleglycerol-phosphate dehydratase